MADHLGEAERIAVAIVARHRAHMAPDTPAHLRPTVYILVGCTCADQGGHYHTHSLDPRRLTYWRAAHPALRIVAAYPV